MFDQNLLEQSITKVITEFKQIRNSSEFENLIYYNQLLIYLKKTSELTEDDQIFDTQIIQTLQILTNNRQISIRNLSWSILNNIVNVHNSEKLEKYIDLYFGQIKTQNDHYLILGNIAIFIRNYCNIQNKQKVIDIFSRNGLMQILLQKLVRDETPVLIKSCLVDLLAVYFRANPQQIFDSVIQAEIL